MPFAGFDGATFTNAPNAGVIFVTLKPFDERVKAGLATATSSMTCAARCRSLREAFVLVIPPPSVPGIGTGGGFKLYVQDRAGRGPRALEQAVGSIIGPANRTPGLVQVFTLFNTSTPQVYADIDRTKAEMLGVPITRFFDTLSTYMGSTFVNDFNILGRTYRVTAQADNPFRLSVRDVENLRTRSSAGDMVPLGSVATFREITGPYRVPRYNLFPAAEVQGSTLPGFSTGQAIAAMESIIATNLPSGFGFEWTEIALQEKIAGNTAVVAFSLAVVFVFLLLAAQYESVLLPLAVILIVPMCLLAAISGVLLRGMDNNILTQIGFVVLIGLAAKNAILIVEFARQAEEQGADRREAAVRRGPHPPAPDPDDVARLRAGRGAAGAGDRRRRRDAAGARHRRVLRHARRDIVRADVHAGVLRAGALDRFAAPRAIELMAMTLFRIAAARSGYFSDGKAHVRWMRSAALNAAIRSRKLSVSAISSQPLSSRSRRTGSMVKP